MTTPHAPFTVEVHPDPAGCVVAPRGELDIAAVDRVREQVDAALQLGPSILVLDLRGVTFLDSTGLRMLFGAHAHARRRGVELSVRDGDPRVGRVLELSGAWSVLQRAR